MAVPAAAPGLPTSSAAAGAEPAAGADPAAAAGADPAAAAGAVPAAAAGAVPAAAAGAEPAAASAPAAGTPAADRSGRPPAVVRQPRDFGHLIGDVLTQRVLLQDGERVLHPVRLPPADRVGPWLERRAPRFETDADGRPWLAIDYQFVNAPRGLTTTQLPPLVIATAAEPVARTAGQDPRTAAAGPALSVPAWPVSVGPLGAPTPSLDPAALRPDAPLRLPSTAALERRLAASAAALAFVLAAWLGWWAWRERREAVRLPFARAERELRRLDPASAAAWQCLHRALDASAGRVVPAAGLARWLGERPELQPLQPRLEDFYRRSARRFFDPDGAAAAAAGDLLGLCRALRHAERRHAR
jgi:mxaA protein